VTSSLLSDVALTVLLLNIVYVRVTGVELPGESSEYRIRLLEG